MNIQKFIELEETKDSILQKLKYLRNGGLNEYIDYVLSEMGLKKLPQKNDDQIIQQILSKTPNDLNKKVASKEHYKAHLCALKNVFEEMLLNDGFIENIEKYNIEEGKDMVVYNYYNLLREMLFDLALFIQDYKQVIKKENPEKFSVGKNLYQRDFSLYQLVPQIIFGQVSFHSFIEREPNLSIAVIRQLLELKIRRGFGIIGTYDKSKDSFEPLPLSQIFDELKLFKNDIDFAIPLENIIRINGWANIFMHSGMKDYTWTLIFVFRYMHEFIKGRTINGKWNSNSGIRIKQTTLDTIIDGLELKLIEKNENLILHKSKPDIEIIT